MTKPRDSLEDAGAWAFTNGPSITLSTSTFDEARSHDFDALPLPGGVVNPDKLRIRVEVVQFVTSLFDAGKNPVAAICHGWCSKPAQTGQTRR
jgi:protease I